MLQEDVGTFLSKMKVISSISRHSSTFSEVFIFQWNLPLRSPASKVTINVVCLANLLYTKFNYIIIWLCLKGILYHSPDLCLTCLRKETNMSIILLSLKNTLNLRFPYLVLQIFPWHIIQSSKSRLSPPLIS